MKIKTAKFRCDLCGEFRSIGVTESQPKHSAEEGDASTETDICTVCIVNAVGLLADRVESTGAS